MIGIYFDSGQLPVRFPIYIGIIALAVLVLRYGHTRFPYSRMRHKKPETTSEEADRKP